MIKLLAFKYPTVIDVDTQRKIKPIHFSTNTQNIQELIKKLLFENKFNYLLIGLDNKLYICECVDSKNKLYSRREIFYHPYQNEIYASK